jgi:hypothetical protein
MNLLESLNLKFRIWFTFIVIVGVGLLATIYLPAINQNWLKTTLYLISGVLILKLGLNLNKSIDLIGFELDEKRRNECKRLSQLNGVNDVKLLKKGTPQNLASVVKKYKKGLIFCDCEGCEFTLFSKSMIKNLTNFDLLIEIHDIEEGESAFNIFIKKLSKHFDIDIIGANKILNMNKIEDVKIPKFILREIFTEGRIKSVGWIYAKSKSN